MKSENKNYGQLFVRKLAPQCGNILNTNIQLIYPNMEGPVLAYGVEFFYCNNSHILEIKADVSNRKNKLNDNSIYIYDFKT